MKTCIVIENHLPTNNNTLATCKAFCVKNVKLEDILAPNNTIQPAFACFYWALLSKSWMHRWYQPTGPLCSQMTKGKVLNWHGFMLGCSVDRIGATACRRGDQGALSSTKTSLLNIVGPSLGVCVCECVCVCTGLTGCLSQLHYTTIRVTEEAFDSSLHPPFSADWKQVEHKNHKSPVK